MTLDQNKPTWYTDAKKYWDSVPSDVQGMLGGYGSLTDIDARGSTRFIGEFFEKKLLKNNRACDCGAGIGRVSKSFLLQHFDAVDLVEQTEKFLEQAKIDFTDAGQADRVERYIPLGLQDFTPEQGRYDLIWCQWVLSHLTDKDLIAFFKRCKESLSGGYICVKENVCKAGVEYDELDSSCTRSEYIWRGLFETAGLIIVKEAKQNAFPESLYEVKMFLLK
ncbi:hypothetical protein HDV01_000363 [Terramyces sp. JEL0728]|nr:hypothetical protein HDV01_000363 [Terramyces sp. JEL0728]